MRSILVKQLKEKGFNLREDIENLADPIVTDALNSLLVIHSTLQRAGLGESIDRIGIYITQLTNLDVDNQKKLYLAHLNCFDEENNLAMEKLTKALDINEVSSFNTIIQSFLLFSEVSNLCNFHQGTEELYMSFKRMPSEKFHSLTLEKLRQDSEKLSNEQEIREKAYEDALWDQYNRFEQYQLNLFTTVVSTKEDYKLLINLFGKKALIEGLKVTENAFELMSLARGFEEICYSSNNLDNKSNFSNPYILFRSDSPLPHEATDADDGMKIEKAVAPANNANVKELEEIEEPNYIDYSYEQNNTSLRF